MNVKSFLSILSHDELAHIIRHVKGNTLLPLLVSRPFSQITHLLFDNLHINSSDSIFFNFKDCTLGIGLGCNFYMAQLVLQTCGKVFKQVRFHKIKPVNSAAIQRFAHLFSCFICDKTKLSIIGIDGLQLLEIFTKKFGKCIDDLEIDLQESPCPFTLVESFRAIFTSSSLKSFTYFGRHVDRIESIWELVGDCLEKVKLQIVDDAGWKNCIEKIGVHCRNVTHLNFEDPLRDSQVREGDLVKLFTSYGKQLVSADFRFLSVGACATIASECMNLRCFIWNEEPKIEFGLLSTLHNRIASLYLNIDVECAENWKALSYEMKSCTSLNSLIVIPSENLASIPISEQCLATICCTSMRYLKSLTIGSVSSPALVHVSKVTSGLKYLEVSCWLPISTDAFGKVCKANPCLRTIKITEYAANPATRAENLKTKTVLKQLIGAARYCRVLETFVLRFSARMHLTEPELRDICAPFRLRNIAYHFMFRLYRQE